MLDNKRKGNRELCTIDKFLNKYKEKEGERFKSSKIKYAQQYVEKMTIDAMKDILDLDEKMKKVIKEIEKWNAK